MNKSYGYRIDLIQTVNEDGVLRKTLTTVMYDFGFTTQQNAMAHMNKAFDNFTKNSPNFKEEDKYLFTVAEVGELGHINLI